MHYLIIAVLAFGMSLTGCEGKTGPAGPTDPSGAAGPKGDKGDPGEQGPEGPAGIPATGGIDTIELAQAHHIPFKIGDDKRSAPQKVVLRVREDFMVDAAVRSQSGKVLESIPVVRSVQKNEEEAITLGDDGMLTADGRGEATITASSEIAGHFVTSSRSFRVGATGH